MLSLLNAGSVPLRYMPCRASSPRPHRHPTAYAEANDVQGKLRNDDRQALAFQVDIECPGNSWSEVFDAPGNFAIVFGQMSTHGLLSRV